MIGELKHRITIETRTQTPDGSGGFTESWSTHATVWARVRPVRASERFFAERLTETTSHLILIRYRSGLNAGMRISYGVRIFKIQGIVNVDERNRFLELLCEEGSGS